MTLSAANRAERCFAVARSTSFAGEREAAIARGIVIANKAGLQLDQFDIPGQFRSTTASIASPPRAPDWQPIDFEAWFAGLDEAVAAVRTARANSDAGFKARLQQKARWPDTHACADFVFSRGIPVYHLGDALDEPWHCPGRGDLDDQSLRDIADQLSL